MDNGTGHKFFDEMKVDSYSAVFVLLYSIHWCCSFPCNEARLLKMSIPLRLEAKEQKIQIRFRPWEFSQETSVRFGCQMSFPPFHCRRMDCWFISDMVLPKSFGIHYFLHVWESIFLAANLQVRTNALSLETLLQEGKAAIFMTFVMFGPLRAKVGYIFVQLINRPIQVHSTLKSKSCPCSYRAEDLRMISDANIWKVKCAKMILVHHEGFLKETSWNKWKKMDNGKDAHEEKKTRKNDILLSQTSIELSSPKHKSQMFQLISHHSTNGDVHRLSIWIHLGSQTVHLGSRLVSWQVELPTPERLGGWLHAVEASKKDWDRLQKICPDVRMSFHGLMIALEWILDVLYMFFRIQQLLEPCLIRKHAFITRFRMLKSRPPKFRVCCYSPQVRVGSWIQRVGGVGQVSADLYGFVTNTLILLCIFKSMETI